MKLLLLFAAVAYGAKEIMTWEEWKAEFEPKRNFLTALNEAERRERFEQNIIKIKQQNARHDAGQSGYRFGVNQFADLSADEFAEVAGLGRPMPQQTSGDLKIVWLEETDVTSIDWRSKGAVTDVKNQGQCGSCWSFSSTGAMEGSLAADTGTLLSFSEKELMDCSKSVGNNSCEGGLMDYAFQWVIRNGGIDTESDYPYRPVDGTCDATKERKHAATFKSYADVTPNNAAQLMAAVAQRPCSIAIEADKEAFQLYSGGVLDKASCGTKLDHGVLVVGYTEVNDANYPNAWIVKNSWGPTWGASGYVYISRETTSSPKGICGLLQQPSYITGGAVGPAPGPGPTPAPGGDAYENPNVGNCKNNETKLTLSNSGVVCAPACVSDEECPAAPVGFNGTPKCKVHDSLTGQKFCTIECQYDAESDDCGSNGGTDTSHTGASCQVYCDTANCDWMCMYAAATPTDRLAKMQAY